MGWQATIVAVQAVPARDLKTAMARIRPDEPVGCGPDSLIRAEGVRRPGQAVYLDQSRRPTRHQDHTRESFRRAASGTAQAELVALWIGQDVPVLVPPADVDLSRADGEPPIEPGLLVAVEGLTSRCSRFLAGSGPSGTNRKSISNGLPSTPIDTP
jgi:hypothetical protein